MKKTIKFFAAALVLAAAVSCAKEIAINEAPLASNSFSATIAAPDATKVDIADNGMMTFTAGDYIIAFINNSTTEKNFYNTSFTTVDGKLVLKDPGDAGRIIAEKIEITDAMLSNGGRTVNFSTVISDVENPDARARCYHFLYISSSAIGEWSYSTSRKDANANYSAATNFYRKQNSAYTAAYKKVFCYTYSSAKSGNLKFYHFDSQFKFKVSDTEKYDRVTIVANGTAGATNSINPDITFYPGRVKDFTQEYSGSNLNYNPNTVGTGTHPTWNKGCYGYTHNSNETNGSSAIEVALSGDASSVYYVQVPALYAYENGISFNLCKSGAVVKTLTINSPITTAAAGVINFGDLAKVNKNTYTSYYEMWCDGKAIKIGENTIDPTAAPYSSLTPVLIESSCNLSSISNWTTGDKIFFIKSGATLTIDSAKYWNDASSTLAIVGDEIGTRSNVVWNATLAPRGGTAILKNINITSSIVNSLDSEGKLSPYLIVDGCRIVLPAGDFAKAISGASSGWNRIELVNNDFIYTGGVVSSFARVLPTAAYTFDTLIVKNNQSYTADGTLAGANSVLIWDYWQMRVSFQNIDFENNTFINTAYNYNVIYFANQGVAVGGNLTIKNNINYVNGPATGYSKFVLLADANKTGVNISASNNFCWATADMGKLQAWGNVSCTPFSAAPFETTDFVNGVFTLTAAAAAQAPGCGAQR